MGTKTGTRIGRGGVAVLLVLATLLLQRSVRADAPLTARNQERMNRATIGLLQRGQNPVDVLDFIVQAEDCFSKSDRSVCNGTAKEAGAQVGIRFNHFVEDFISVSELGGAWFYYEGFSKTTGKVIVVPGTGKWDYEASGTNTKGTPTGFVFYRDSKDDYNFRYSTTTDGGTGYLVWMPGGCALVGFFFSDTLKDTNGNANSGGGVFRRC